ncbi:MAG: hypothetical protein PHI79_08495 [Sulfurovaceae bacterium]|nr:hypothetical protein [Sulfurovaceae bacterium]MDD5549615.1 hypothetical protein [Sulfurovaceae bacterium]
MYKNIFVFLVVISQVASAGNGFASEFSHFAGGLIMTALVAFMVFKYFPKYKTKSVLIGFLVSLLYVFIDQSIDYIKYGKFLDQLLDFTVHVIGSLISVYIGYKVIKK